MAYYPWTVLGIEPTRDAREIRSAYAKKLKVTQPEDDAEGFQRLRAAYEQALGYAARGAVEEEVEVAAPEPTQSNLDELFPDRLRPKPAEADELTVWIGRALRSLETELRARNLDSARRALGEILESPHLERFDVLQRAESAVAELLAMTTPFADPLLKAAADRFEWPHRQLDPSTPRDARALVKRLADLWFLDRLKSGTHEDSKAWQRLQLPPGKVRRLSLEYLFTVEEWPERRLLDKLEYEHRSLFQMIPRETVDWWRAAGARPRFPILTCLAAFVPALFISMALWSPATGSTPLGVFWLTALGLSVGTGLVRWLAIDWPIKFTSEYWHGRPPRWFRLGWLPTGVFALALSLAWIDLVWIPWMVWLAWIGPVIAVATALWATIAAGPTRPLFGAMKFDFSNSRLLMILVLNVLVALWLFLTNEGVPGLFRLPVIVTLAGVLAASGAGRYLLINFFNSELAVSRQRLLCAVGIAIAVLAGFLLLHFGTNPWMYPPLIGLVLVFVLLRRAVPFEGPTAHPYAYGIVLFLVFRGAVVLREFAAFDSDTNDIFHPGFMIDGGLTLLAGGAISLGVRLWKMRNQ